MNIKDTTIGVTLRQETVYELAALAIDIGLTPPARQNLYVHEARVPWRLINKVRATLDGEGIDWRSVKTKMGGRRGA